MQKACLPIASLYVSQTSPQKAFLAKIVSMGQSLLSFLGEALLALPSLIRLLRETTQALFGHANKALTQASSIRTG